MDTESTMLPGTSGGAWQLLTSPPHVPFFCPVRLSLSRSTSSNESPALSTHHGLIPQPHRPILISSSQVSVDLSHSPGPPKLTTASATRPAPALNGLTRSPNHVFHTVVEHFKLLTICFTPELHTEFLSFFAQL